MSAAPACEEIDPFDLPEWLGVHPVVWCADAGLEGWLVPGRLRSDEDGAEVPCDLLAADVAFPKPVVTDDVRTRVHQAWRHGQVHLVEREGRLAIAVPGAAHRAEDVLEALGRLAKAVGAQPDRFAALLRVGRDR